MGVPGFRSWAMSAGKRPSDMAWWSVLKTGQGSREAAWLKLGVSGFCCSLGGIVTNPFPFINHVFLVVLCDPAQSCCEMSQARDLPCTLQLCGCPLRKLETCGHMTKVMVGPSLDVSMKQ